MSLVSQSKTSLFVANAARPRRLHKNTPTKTKKTAVFFWWTCFFAFVWTPLLVGLVYLVGERIIAPFHYFFGTGWLSILLAVITLFVTIRLVTLLTLILLAVSTAGMAFFLSFLRLVRPGEALVEVYEVE